ncbi:MAG: polysaccharide biosynthesis protein [bacterium]|nr:polysaccharide biosynthesis protein [bacterium]
MEANKRKQQSFLHGAMVLVAATALVKVIGAIFKIPLSNLIGDLGFGYFSSAYDLYLPIYALAMAGLPVALSRMIAENMAQKRYRDVGVTLKVARKAFFVTGFTGFAIMLIAIWPFLYITEGGISLNSTLPSMLAIVPALVFCCVISTYRGYYEGLRDMYPTAISEVIEALGKLILGLSFAYIILKLTNNVAFAAAGAMTGITVGTVFAAGYLRIKYKKDGAILTSDELESSPEPRTQRRVLKLLLMIAIPVVLSSLATNIANMIDVTMVKWLLRSVMDRSGEVIRSMYAESIKAYDSASSTALTDAQIPTFLYGIRSKAYTMFNLIPTITSALGVGAIPVLAEMWTKNDRNGIKTNLETVIKTAAIIALPAGLGMAALSPQIMELMYNSTASVEIGAPMLLVLGIASVFAGITIPLTCILQAIGKQMVPVRNIAIGAIIKIVINFVLVGNPSINIVGACVGTLCCYMFIMIADYICIVKHTKVVPDIYKILFKPFIAALACGFAAYAVARVLNSVDLGNLISTAGGIVTGGIIYLIFVILLKIIDREDILSLPKGKKFIKALEKFKIIK